MWLPPALEGAEPPPDGAGVDWGLGTLLPPSGRCQLPRGELGEELPWPPPLFMLLFGRFMLFQPSIPFPPFARMSVRVKVPTEREPGEYSRPETPLLPFAMLPFASPR